MWGWVLFLVFVVLPIAEIYLLVQLAGWTSFWAVLGLVVVTALFGSYLLRLEGARVWREFRGDLTAGRVPARSMVQGLLLAVGGAFLVTPGILTDATGLLLMLPFARRPLAGLIVKRLGNRFHVGHPAGAGKQPPGGDDVRVDYEVR